MIDERQDSKLSKTRLLVVAGQRACVESRSLLGQSAADQGRGLQTQRAISGVAWSTGANVAASVDVTVLERPDALLRQIQSLHAQQAELADLSQRLIVEFAGDLPAGQVLACVTRCTHHLVRNGVRAGLASTTEAMARSRLTAQLLRA